MQFKCFIILMLLALSAACDRTTVSKSTSASLKLTFAEKEADVEPYKTRVIITPEFMRFDDGEGATDFLLFNRKEKAIYSVVQQNKSITVITAESAKVKPPIELRLSQKKVDDMKDAPTMEGVKPVHHVYLSGDQVCFEAVAVPGFLPEYVKAMQEFNAILANDAAVTMNNMPEDMMNGCSLAKSVFAPNRHLLAGFPIQVWGPDGTQSALLEFEKNYPVDKTLFELPASYQRLNIQDIRTRFAK